MTPVVFVLWLVTTGPQFTLAAPVAQLPSFAACQAYAAEMEQRPAFLRSRWDVANRGGTQTTVCLPAGERP